MKSVVIMDRTRNKTCKALCTFGTGKDRELIWQETAFKFIFFRDETLVIGPIFDHTYLYCVYMVRDEPLDADLASKAKAVLKRAWEDGDRAIIGAGKVDQNGTVTGWKSGGFGVETPLSLREAISREIRRLFEAGELTPK